MIDPKFNEIDDTNQTGLKKTTETGLTEDTSAADKPRRGLSINDTIAADANLSVGSRGADTSGVRAGVGAGAGSTYVTPGSSGSPAPTVVPGARGSGSTPLSTANPEQIPTMDEDQPHATTPPSGNTASSDAGSGSEDSYALTSEEISAHAYRCWVERGSPHGSAEEDWHRAERELRERARNPKASSASA